MKYSIFNEPPTDFNPTVEVASCYCECEDKILLLKRHPNRPQGNTWGVPAGKLEKGEDPRTAVIREVKEEVGLEINDQGLEKIGTQYIRLPHVDYVYHMFRIRFVNFPEIKLGMDEHLESKWLTIPEILEMPLITGGGDALNFYRKFVNQKNSR